MTAAFVVRILRPGSGDDDMAGSIEVVDTGAVEVWHGPDELVALLRRATATDDR